VERENLLAILKSIQEQYGYIPERVILNLSKKNRIPETEIFSVASFYKHFRFKPQGKKVIKICLGTACHVKGAEILLNDLKEKLKIEIGETTEDRKYTLERVACIGCCALAPCVMINEKVYAKVKRTHIEEILKDE